MSCIGKNEEGSDGEHKKEEGQQQEHDTGNGICKDHLKPNHQLTPEERSDKQALKRLMKQQARRKKLETRLQQAIMRNDKATEKMSREALHRFLEQEQTKLEQQAQQQPEKAVRHHHHVAVHPIPVKIKYQRPQNEAAAHKQLKTLYLEFLEVLQNRHQERQNQLQNHSKEEGNGSSSKTEDVKLHQTAQARLLLLNMTKGTQTESMFENHDALYGYTRQKFLERAVLVMDSLNRLNPQQLPLKLDLDNQKELLAKAWECLSSGSVRSICSIGCGPGCDVTGLLSFFQQFSNPCNETNTNSEQPAVLDRVIFLDWTIERWSQILTPLVEDILIPRQMIKRSDVAFCDVRDSLLYASNNALARQLLMNDDASDADEASIREEASCSISVFITSYLLTETRGTWHSFYQDLIHIANTGALFFISEPTAWQLHTLIRMSASKMDWIWLDSSMYSPGLQPLEGRVGPAVLLGIRR